MSLQPFYKSGLKSNATARRLIASVSVAPHVLASTFEYASDQQVICLQVMEACYCGQAVMQACEKVFLVRSKFDNRYYVLKQDGTCSSSDDRVAAACQVKVQSYLLQVKREVAA